MEKDQERSGVGEGENKREHSEMAQGFETSKPVVSVRLSKYPVLSLTQTVGGFLVVREKPAFLRNF